MSLREGSGGTVRRESMPVLVRAAAHWDAEASKVRYYACFEGANDDDAKWTEVPGEDFDRLTRLFAQEAIDIVCHEVVETLEHLKATLEEFSAFREGLEKLDAMTRARAEGTEN